MIKKILLTIYNFPYLSPEKTNFFQKKARDCEWEAIEPYIQKGEFLDIGCGAGYSMHKAQQIGCKVYGIDPDPHGHGVGRRDSEYAIPIVNITQGYSENLPYEDKIFNTIYSSHVLEHVRDISETLTEMNRVCKPNGIIIIGVPTSTMAWIHWLTKLLFTTHQKIVNTLLSVFINTGITFWWEIFVARSHSYPNKKTVISDIINYSTQTWKRHIEKEFEITTIIKPCIYPIPEYRQLFKLRKNKRCSSSVFFICKQK